MSSNNVPNGKSKYTATVYFPSWGIYERQYGVNKLPIGVVPRIAYAFFDARPDPSTGHLIPVSGDPWADFDKRMAGGESVNPPDSWSTPSASGYYGNFGQFYKLKHVQKKQFKLILALFGWTWSSKCSDVYATQDSRKAFVDGLISIFKRYSIFDGVSIDHEYLSDDGKNYGKTGNVARPQDGSNFVEFLRLLRRQLDANGFKHFEISMCCTAAPEKARFPIEKIHPLLTYLEVMTYDFADGGWSAGTCMATHHTNLRPTKHSPYSVQTAVDHYVKRGVPSHKLLVGIATYSRGFSNCEGLHAPSRGGSSDKDWDAGSVDFKNLPRPGATEHWDDEAKASYSYDPVRKVLNSYDCPRSVREKCKFVKQRKLGGVLMWEASGDHPVTHPRSLIKVVRDELLK